MFIIYSTLWSVSGFCACLFEMKNTRRFFERRKKPVFVHISRNEMIFFEFISFPANVTAEAGEKTSEKIIRQKHLTQAVFFLGLFIKTLDAKQHPIGNSLCENLTTYQFIHNIQICLFSSILYPSKPFLLCSLNYIVKARLDVNLLLQISYERSLCRNLWPFVDGLYLYIFSLQGY